MGKTMAIVGECLRMEESVSTNTSHPLPFTIHGQNHGYCLENASGMEEAFLQTPLTLSPSLSMGKTMAIVGECRRHGRSVSTSSLSLTFSLLIY